MMNSNKEGMLYIVGIGPGNAEAMTVQALTAMDRSEILCGYTVYIDLVRDRYAEKELHSTGMMQETERCQWAVDRACEGKTVAVLCSGDSGVYGMAGLILQLSGGKRIGIEVVPGVTAALSGAAILGAPLTHDFCVISLSDLLTPWETIEKRLEGAGMGDFSVCIYNPMSKKRRDHLRKACDILLKYKRPDTICGWVRNIGREGQTSAILTLEELRELETDMFTTVFIGNDSTVVLDGRMVTPRGYEKKWK